MNCERDAVRPDTRDRQVAGQGARGLLSALAAAALMAGCAHADAPAQRVVYLVHVGDDGASGKRIGCGDSLVAVPARVRQRAAPLRGAIEALLAIGSTERAPLQNFWDGSALKVEGVTLSDGVATLRLSGRLVLAGVCDLPRVEAQIEATASQFASVKQVRVLINGIPLTQALR